MSPQFVVGTAGRTSPGIVQRCSAVIVQSAERVRSGRLVRDNGRLYLHSVTAFIDRNRTRKDTCVRIKRNCMAAQSVRGDGSSKQLLIVGPGVLGSHLGSLWLDDFGAGSVVGQTKTTNNHEALSGLGIEARAEGVEGTFPYVAYCAPPSGSEDYAGDVKKALERWDGSGNFVFTSSAGVFSVNDGSTCDESSPVVPMGANPRTDALLQAEQAVLDAGGCVMRLVGLYHRTRGPHTFFLKQGQVARWGGYVVNMIHYEDAASICAAVLKGRGAEGQRYRSRVFVGCDDKPVTFEDMMASIEKSGILSGHVVFTEKDGSDSLGKKMTNDATRRQLQWSPKYSSIIAFFEEHRANDWYVSHQDATKAGAPHTQ